MNLSGNIEGNKNTRGYKAGLLKIYGKDEGQSILDYCDQEQHASYKWSCAEVKEIRLFANKEIKRLEAILNDSSD
jgi:hypothetical protein